MQLEAVRSVERRQYKAAAGPDTGAAKNHIALAGAIAKPGSDDHVIEAITVDVSRPAHRVARVVVVVDAAHNEAVGAVERRKIYPAVSSKIPGAEQHEGFARRMLQLRAEDEIVDPVAVHVARRVQRRAQEIAFGDACHEAIVTIERRQLDDSTGACA